MKLYKKIDIDNYDVIVSKIFLFLKKKKLIDSIHCGYIPLNFNEVSYYCPELIKSFAKLKVLPRLYGIYRTVKDSSVPIHIDTTLYKSRINIPIINCEFSNTVYYKADIKNTQQQGFNTLTYIECINAVEIDRVTVDKTTILRIDHPHQVVMDGTKDLRICLTVACFPDPEFLINKN